MCTHTYIYAKSCCHVTLCVWSCEPPPPGHVRPEDLLDEEEPVTAQPRKPDYQSVGETTPPPSSDRNEIGEDKAAI